MSRSKEESPALVTHGHGRFNGESAGGRPLTSDDADLLAEGANILQREKQLAKDRIARTAREEEYHRVYSALRDEIYLAVGKRSNAQFHGQVYDIADHHPHLAELLLRYFQVLQKTEHIHRLQSLAESAFLHGCETNDNSGLALVCLRYTRRLFHAGVNGASSETLQHKLREVSDNEQLFGVWRCIMWLGVELGQDNQPQVVVNNGRSPANTDGRLKETVPQGAGGPDSQTLASQSQERPLQPAAKNRAQEPKQRPCGRRDTAWLEWYNDKNAETYHSPANIRDKWNSMTDEERKRISPTSFNKIGKSRDVVKKAIQKAQRCNASAEA